MDGFLDTFARAWRRLEPDRTRHCNVAFSGGVDSAVLLAAVRALEPERIVRAVHVDHGLHPASGEWREKCTRMAEAAGAEFLVRAVNVDVDAPSGVEAAAREARYAAFAALLEPGESLLTAHHADDQLETMLMRLFRGTGIGGLAAVRESTTIAGIRVLRPMLELTRAEIEAQAREWRLDWIDDPSNADPRFDRNYVRREIVPAIVRRWPAASAAAVRAARQMGAAEALLRERANEDLELDRERDDAEAASEVARESTGFADDAARPRAVSVPIERLVNLSPARRDNALRRLVRHAGLPLPTTAQLQMLAEALAVERPDAETRVAWPGAEARVHGGRLHVFAPLPPAASAPAGRLGLGRAWCGAAGRLELVPAAEDEPGLPESWLAEDLEVRFRAGGERLRPLHDPHTRELKKLFQDEGIVPWMRARIPLLYGADGLVAVADLWLTDRVRDAPSADPRWRIRWTEHPPLR